MGAITAAEEGLNSVAIFESTSKTLEKVRISGGGRCNVTNACWESKDLARNYPRGEKALLGAFSRFSTGDAVEWFKEKGLHLTIEKDGRMFPRSNSSIEVIRCLQDAAQKAGIKCLTGLDIQKVESLGINKGFRIKSRTKGFFYAKRILLATGGSPTGKKIASELGHKVIQAVPSLFTFKIASSWLKTCAGIAVDDVKIKLKVKDKMFEQYGRILITHWGLSGPAILKLSAFAARDLNLEKYNAKLFINWSSQNIKDAQDLLNLCRKDLSNKKIKNHHPFRNIPKRLWLSILKSIQLNPDINWSNLSKSHGNSLYKALTNNDHIISGKGPFGEEFVTAGGINLNEIKPNTMESRICRNLYFAGEILNVDGVTGGFNFQHCWTSGWIAGQSIAANT